MKELKDLTREEYELMKGSGMMGEIYPEATWDYEKDVEIPNKQTLKKASPSINEIHKIYHKFQKWLIKNFGNDLYSEYKTVRVKQENGRYKSFKWRDYNEYELSKRLCGYEVMERIEKYVKRSCPEIKIVYCDDDVHATSIILLIPHPSHGITMMFIPQLIGIQNRLFLYENHHKELMRVLEEMKHVYDDLNG